MMMTLILSKRDQRVKRSSSQMPKCATAPFWLKPVFGLCVLLPYFCTSRLTRNTRLPSSAPLSRKSASRTSPFRRLEKFENSSRTSPFRRLEKFENFAFPQAREVRYFASPQAEEFAFPKARSKLGFVKITGIFETTHWCVASPTN